MDMIDLLDLHQVLSSNGNSAIAFICQLIHATLLHNSVNQTLLLLTHLQTVVMPSSDSINQLIFLLKLVTPLLGKISTDQDRLKQVVSDFFALVTRVAGGAQHCQDEHISLVSDALFYILDNYPVALKNDLLLQFIAGLPDQFQKRLRLLLQASGAAAF
jgi:Mediator complex subunit 23